MNTPTMRVTRCNGKITGYVVEFPDSDACVECHSGTEAENKRNAETFLRAAMTDTKSAQLATRRQK